MTFAGAWFGRKWVAAKGRDEALASSIGAVGGRGLDSTAETRLVLALAVCHSALVNEEGRAFGGSAEELAFLEFCAAHGVEFLGEEAGEKLLRVNGETLRVPELLRFDFCSERRRMGVVVKVGEEVALFTKGGDDAIFNFIPGDTRARAELEASARQGLRTMLVAEKRVSAEEWEAALMAAEESRRVGASLDLVQKDLERGSTLLAAVALEDELQTGVLAALSTLRAAGVKVWMVTGDKAETAVSVARAAGVFEPQGVVATLGGAADCGESSLLMADTALKAGAESLVVGGSFFAELQRRKIAEPNLYIAFADVLLRSQRIVFSRFSPRQKQEVVRLLSELRSDMVTLAIGDGANDVNMISAAKVGIGILGSEGAAAARASDYAISEFRQLVPLMLVHGRENYRRNSEAIIYTFFKNFMVVLPQYWWGFSNVFSGQPLYDPFLYQLYNVIFAFFPVICYGVLDSTHSAETFLSQPKLYASGPRRIFFSKLRFATTLFVATVLSLFLTLTALALFDWEPKPDGFSFGLFNFGNMVFFGVILLVNSRVLVMSNSFSPFLILICFLSTASFILSWKVESTQIGSQLYNTFSEIIHTQEFITYLLLLFGIIVSDMTFSKMYYLAVEAPFDVPAKWAPELDPLRTRLTLDD